MIDSDSPVLDLLAAAAHGVNRAYCQYLGDFTLTPWEDAPDWQKRSVLQGVIGVLNGNTPEQSHESWLREKEATGWTYGPVKDPEKKEHPCFLPYADLPAHQRKKDDLFVQTVRSMAGAIGVHCQPLNKPLSAEPRHANLETMLRFFKSSHLPAHLQTVVRPFEELAETLADGPYNAETSAGLRKLLEAKDCAVRAHLV